MATTPHAAALIDSDVLIDAARGHPEATAFLYNQNRAFGVQISTISAMELIVGCRKQNRTQPNQTLSRNSSDPLSRTKYLRQGLRLNSAVHPQSWADDS